MTPLFQETLKRHMVIFSDLPEKLKKFTAIKKDNPLTNRYGKHDGPFAHGSPLAGFWHCHLRDDAILIYNLKNRAINLVAIVAHAEIEGNRRKAVVKQISPYK
jgi:mRNA-degrading endonuclease YafQ of YafQ-DinJ toxin-antitoxin module